MTPWVGEMWLSNDCHQRQEQASEAPLVTVRCMARLGRIVSSYAKDLVLEALLGLEHLDNVVAINV